MPPSATSISRRSLVHAAGGAALLAGTSFAGVTVRAQDATPGASPAAASAGFTAEEIEDSIEAGTIRVDCQFCSKRYAFDPAEFRPQN